MTTKCPKHTTGGGPCYCGRSDEAPHSALFELVLEEAKRATEKYPTWPTDPLHALAVLGEEYGELTKAMLQLTYEPWKTSATDVREEAIQTAAMAIRLAMSLERYEYRASEQHTQVRRVSEIGR